MSSSLTSPTRPLYAESSSAHIMYSPFSPSAFPLQIAGKERGRGTLVSLGGYLGHINVQCFRRVLVRPSLFRSRKSAAWATACEHVTHSALENHQRLNVLKRS